MLIEVSEIHPPKPGGKVSRIVAADGQHHEIWPDTLHGVAPGRPYEVDSQRPGPSTKIGARAVRLGTVEVPDEAAAIEKGAAEYKVSATRLMAIRR
jgi:hypothetical protein